MTKWGIVATIKAAQIDVLNFAAYHLDQGAHRLYIYLDEPAPDTYDALKAHAKIRVTACDEAYWQKQGGKRPTKHQVRQTRNATHAYHRKAEVDWLAHIDVDEFLWPTKDIANILAGLPTNTLCARLHPIELLADGTHAFKSYIPSGPERAALVEHLYPTYGAYLKGGFLSHVAGKLFVRIGLANISFRIHNVFQGDLMNPGEALLSQIELCHCHATSWNAWISAYRYRLSKGAYRADLTPAKAGGVTLHELLVTLEAKGGDDALRGFFDEVAADSPNLRARLEAQGLLRACDLDLDSKRSAHFPRC